MWFLLFKYLFAPFVNYNYLLVTEAPIFWCCAASAGKFGGKGGGLIVGLCTFCKLQYILGDFFLCYPPHPPPKNQSL